MGNSLMKPHNLGLNPPAFPFPNPPISITNSNLSHHIEMIALQSKSYTSLKDLLPDSPPWTPSPTTSCWKDSWREIPIKDPLLQHAAWAYLQPMGAELEEHHRWWSRLTETCCGCFNGIVLMVFGGWFSGQWSEGLAVDHGEEVD